MTLQLCCDSHKSTNKNNVSLGHIITKPMLPDWVDFHPVGWNLIAHQNWFGWLDKLFDNFTSIQISTFYRPS